MTSVVTTRRAKARLNDGFIEIRGYVPPDLAELIQTLPAGGFSRSRGCMTCRPTPLAAWRLICEAPPDEVPEVTEEVELLAARHDAMIDAREAILAADELPQPEIRKADLWPHQLPPYWFALAGDSTLLSLYMGTGKSKIAVDVVVNSGSKTTLVLCPASVLGVWRREFLKWADWDDSRVLVLSGSQTSKKKAERAAQHVNVCEIRGEPSVVVLNYETAIQPVMAKWLVSQEWDCVVCDESQKIKSNDAKSSRLAAKIGMKAKRRLALTGTPMPHSPLDVFGQFKFLEPAVYGSSWHPFLRTFAVTGDLGQVVDIRNREELAKRMQPFTFEIDRVSAEAMLKLPEYVDEQIPVELSAKLRKVYEQFERELVVEVRAGAFDHLIGNDGDFDSGDDDSDDPAMLSASNAMVKLLRLQQLTGGFAVTESASGVEETIRVGDEKQRALMDLIDGTSTDEVFVVFGRFRADLDAAKAVAEMLGREYGELSGRQKDLNSHAEIPHDFRGVFAVQIQAGGVGVDLTRARYGCYYSIGYSMGDYEQSRARLVRPGQTRPVVFYHLIATDTVDIRVYGSLAKKRRIVDSVLEYLREK